MQWSEHGRLKLDWLYQPLAVRRLIMEAMIDANIWLFKNDLFRWTRAKASRSPTISTPPRRTSAGSHSCVTLHRPEAHSELSHYAA
jgi:hypothetical protein